MDSSVQRESFIVRVWWKPGQAVQEVWIQHIRSGEWAVVHDLEGVAVFIGRWAPLCLLAPAAQAQVSGTGQAKPAEKDRQGLR
jgi:hypothetical protein